jgi:ABC-type uncharacterized transport system substrate-binding protein
MRRREFITLLGGAAATWPLAAHAQGERMRHIGVLVGFSENDPEWQARLVVFRQALEKFGWSEGRNIRIDYRFSRASADQAQLFAKELVTLQPEVILVQSPHVATALQRETRTIPIVFVDISDPIGSGFVASLARPGGNFTGLLLYEEGITGKWLAMVKEIAPQVTRAALLMNSKASSYVHHLPDAQAKAASLAIDLSRIENTTDIEGAIRSFARIPNGGLIVLPDATNILHRDLIVTLAAQHRLPAVYSARYWATAGGLISYGTDAVDQFRQTALYIDRILRGAKPADLPVQAPTKYETVINLKTAKTLGLTITDKLLVAADEVIE